MQGDAMQGDAMRTQRTKIYKCTIPAVLSLCSHGTVILSCQVIITVPCLLACHGSMHALMYDLYVCALKKCAHTWRSHRADIFLRVSHIGFGNDLLHGYNGKLVSETILKALSNEHMLVLMTCTAGKPECIILLASTESLLWSLLLDFYFSFLDSCFFCWLTLIRHSYMQVCTASQSWHPPTYQVSCVACCTVWYIHSDYTVSEDALGVIV